MDSHTALLLALQHGDSFFPGGMIPFSWGLETLAFERAVVSAADLGRFVEGQLRYRWATCDRPALVGAYQAADTLNDVTRVDVMLDAMALSREMREGGRRAGGAMLDVHTSLGTPHAAEYRAVVRAGHAHGQLAVVQGLVWRGVGLSEENAGAVSGHLVCVGFVGAAIRLGLIGHVDGQAILTEMGSVLGELLEEAPLPFEGISNYSPASEIAMMRHEAGVVRMFAN